MVSKTFRYGSKHKISHSFTSMGSKRTYYKLLSNLIHLLWKILRLSLVSQLYLKLCSFYLIFSFVLGLDRLFISTLPLWYTNSTYFPSFLLNIPLPPPSPPVFYYIGGSFHSNGFHKFIFLCGERQSKP